MPIKYGSSVCRNLRRKSGLVSLRSPSRESACVAIVHFVGILQKIGYGFSARDRKIFSNGMDWFTNDGTRTCPNCGERARFLPVNNSGNPKAWFCKCSYEDGHMNGLKSGD